MSDAIDFLQRLQVKFKSNEIDWERQLESFYLKILGGKSDLGIIDIGGHAGRHSIVFHEQLKPKSLVIVEPIPWLSAQLGKRFESSPNVVVMNLALGKEAGTSSFVVKRGAPEESGLRQRSFYNDGSFLDLENITVEVRTLDDLDLPTKIDFIKIDTEGGEIDIIAGGERTIKERLPAISVEFGPGGYDAYGHGPDALFSCAQKMSYDVYDLFGNRFVSLEEWRLCVSKFYWDFVLVPSSKRDTLSPRIASIREEALGQYG